MLTKFTPLTLTFARTEFSAYEQHLKANSSKRKMLGRSQQTSFGFLNLFILLGWSTVTILFQYEKGMVVHKREKIELTTFFVPTFVNTFLHLSKLVPARHIILIENWTFCFHTSQCIYVLDKILKVWATLGPLIIITNFSKLNESKSIINESWKLLYIYLIATTGSTYKWMHGWMWSSSLEQTTSL